jgi:hypothetical protein
MSAMRTLRIGGVSATVLLWVVVGCSGNHNDVTGNIDDDEDQDITAPAAVSDLHVARLGATDVELCWTAPGDDSVTGRAVEYQVRGSLDSITPANFDSQLVLSGFPFPDSAGTTQCFAAAGLTGEETYWAALKTRDESGNWSDLSNCIRFTCLTDSIVLFTDTALERAVRLALMRPTEPLRRSHVVALHYLLADNQGIADLTGLEYCTSLQMLTLPNNSIRNLQPLAACRRLRVLSVVNNQITDLTPLASLDSLTAFLASRNPISDLSALAGLSSLTDLSLAAVSTGDFSVLSGLASLESLDLSGNAMASLGMLSPLVHLQSLSLVACNLADLSALQSMSGLEELVLAVNQVVDLAPLVSLGNLTHLDLHHNSVADISPLLSNPGLGQGDVVRLTENPLSAESISQHIPALQARGVTVTW